MNPVNQFVVKILPVLPRSLVSLVSRRYIAGEGLEDAMEMSRQLNAEKAYVTMDVLGENITKLEDAEAAKNACLDVLDAINKNEIEGNISIKLTQLGLKLDKSFCIENVREIVDRAKSYDSFVRIDMEDSTCTDDTIEICLLMRDYYEQVGTVIQAYLKRSEEDVLMLAGRNVNLRICKGIYQESEKIAYKDPDRIRHNFIQLVKILMKQSVYVAIATHDPQLVNHSLSLIEAGELPTSAYEFQMLLGVAKTLRNELILKGHKLRVYVPFGRHWYAYSVRRLKENPQIAGYIFKNIFRR